MRTTTRFRRAAAVLIAGIALAACAESAGETTTATPRSVLQDVPDSAWATLAQRRIFFGHQSVGFNILDGVQEIVAADPRVKLSVVQSKTPEAVPGPALVHATVGDNRRPDLKNSEFAAIVDRGFGDSGDVAMYKYCYLDIGRDSDPKQLFAEYKRTVDGVRARHPKLTLVHITQPLFAAEHPLASALRTALGKSSDRVVNAKRDAFNRMLRAEYGGTGLLFDLAEIESTRPDGTRETYKVGGDTVYGLAKQYTDDGGHLNARGRRVAAEHFLAFLATLPARSE